jgi:meiotically up-regulated gene 157 (Mug157) protein
MPQQGIGAEAAFTGMTWSGSCRGFSRLIIMLLNCRHMRITRVDAQRSHSRAADKHLGFRPSDDACKYPFLVPANMFAVVTLGYLAEIAEHVYHEPALSAEALELRRQIDDGTKPH